MAGIMPLSTFDLTSMQKIASDTRGFSFLAEWIYTLLSRGYYERCLSSEWGLKFQWARVEFRHLSLKRVPIFSRARVTPRPCTALVRANP